MKKKIYPIILIITLIFINACAEYKPIYTTNSSKSNYLRNKIISLESPWNIRDSKGKKLQNINTIDDLFTDFY